MSIYAIQLKHMLTGLCASSRHVVRFQALTLSICRVSVDTVRRCHLSSHPYFYYRGVLGGGIEDQHSKVAGSIPGDL
jgi:hypothetical protein